MTRTAASSTHSELSATAADPVGKVTPAMRGGFFGAAGGVSGQPSASSKPFLVSGSLGHLSSLSRMPSPSLSGSGQPSASSKPSLSSGSSGHLSSASGMPSPSVSLGGAGGGVGAGGGGAGFLPPKVA